MVDRQGLMAHSIELEYGLSNKWTAGVYLDFEQPKGQDLKHIRTKALMFHGRFWEKGERPVDLGLYVEYILPRKEYKNVEQIEIKWILEKDFRFHSVVLNPTFEKNISEPDVDEGVEFALNGGWNRWKYVPKIIRLPFRKIYPARSICRPNSVTAACPTRWPIFLGSIADR